jgi:hypothetical protein
MLAFAAEAAPKQHQRRRRQKGDCKRRVHINYRSEKAVALELEIDGSSSYWLPA